MVSHERRSEPFMRFPIFMSIMFIIDRDINESHSAMSLNMADGEAIKSAAARTPEFITGLGPADIEDNQNLCNIIFNSILYINDPTRETSETEAKFSSKIKIGNGKHVTRNYILLRPPKSYKSISFANGKSLDVRFVVRGHWRNQVCGINRSERKLIWIKPFWKGPEISEIVNKKYFVQ